MLLSSLWSSFSSAFVTVAHAQASGSAPAQPGMLESMLPLAVIFVVFYFFIIRPQAKNRKEHQKVLESLKRGDKVLTASGILGTIEGLTDAFVTLEIAEGVSVKILRSQISGLASKEGTKA